MGGPKYVGVVGQNCCGKDTVGDLLDGFGYKKIDFGSLIREEVARRGLEVSRENTIMVANDVRTKEGGDAWAKRIAAKIKGTDGKWVVCSFRHPKEVTILKELPGFTLIQVTTPIEVRYERAKARGREEVAPTLEAFREKEKIENKTSGDNVQRISDCEKMADITIENDGTLDELRQKVIKALGVE